MPFTASECFYVAIFAFIVIGFMRGWRRELVSLVFVLLAVVLIRPGISDAIEQFFSRLVYILTNSSSSTTLPSLGVWGTLFLFGVVVLIGYLVGNRVFPKPATPAEQIIGVIPGIISGAFIMFYLVNGDFFSKTADGQSVFSVVVQPPNPLNYIPIMFIVSVVALVVALIMSRTKKAAPPAKK